MLAGGKPSQLVISTKMFSEAVKEKEKRGLREGKVGSERVTSERVQQEEERVTKHTTPPRWRPHLDMKPDS